MAKILSIYDNSSGTLSLSDKKSILPDNKSIKLNRHKTDIQYYNSLPEPLRLQLIKLQKILITDKDIQKTFKKYFIYANSDYENNPELYQLAILYCIPSIYFFEKSWFKHVFCYDNTGHRVYPQKVISVNKHTYVLTGNGRGHYNQEFIIKWYHSGSRNILNEIDMYKRLKKLNCPVPYFATKFYFWDEPVLVMEKLNPLDKSDDEFLIGIAILKQLRFLHTFGVHNDIKPQNIMKRVDNTKTTYFLIDHGGLTIEKFKYGFRRRIWSSKFTSQKPHVSNQLTTAIHDLLELGYTMKYLQVKYKPKYNLTTNIKSGFRGKIKKYMKQIEKITNNQVTKKDYIELINILK